MTPCRRRPETVKPQGFTLIEVLVIVVLIGVVSSVVLISLAVVGDDRELEREARRIASLVELAADEAELQGRDFGIEFLRSGFRFVEYDPFFDTWAEVAGDDVLRPRDLPEGLELSLEVEDRRVELNARAADTGSDREDEDGDDREDRGMRIDRYAPHGMILSNGDLSPFELTIERYDDGAQEVVRVLPDGRIVVGEVLPDELG